MKHPFIILISVLLFWNSVNAQERVIDATDHTPVSAASIFDAAGNMVGFTWNDGEFSEIPVAWDMNSLSSNVPKTRHGK